MSAPRKLPDGSWSDGVDRSRRINTALFPTKNYRRWHVWGNPHGVWFACCRLGNAIAYETHSSHAEAIAYADKAARNA